MQLLHGVSLLQRTLRRLHKVQELMQSLTPFKPFKPRLLDMKLTLQDAFVFECCPSWCTWNVCLQVRSEIATLLLLTVVVASSYVR